MPTNEQIEAAAIALHAASNGYVGDDIMASWRQMISMHRDHWRNLAVVTLNATSTPEPAPGIETFAALTARAERQATTIEMQQCELEQLRARLQAKEERA